MIDAKELNQRLDPLDVLARIGYEHSRPKLSGRWIRDCCPLHGERPKKSGAGDLAIDPTSKMFVCHSCEAKGDLVDLYGRATRVPFKQALLELSGQESSCNTASRIASYSVKKAGPSNTKVFEGRYESYLDDVETINRHPYMLRKKIAYVPGLRLNNASSYCSVVVPMRDAGGALKAMIYIAEDGEKKFATGSCVDGSFFGIQSKRVRAGEPIVYVCEGVATAITVYNVLEGGYTVVSVGPYANIHCVVNSLSDAMYERIPSLSFILALDSDIVGEKRKKLFEKIRAKKVLWVAPEVCEKCDFNDLISKCNYPKHRVKTMLNNVQAMRF